FTTARSKNASWRSDSSTHTRAPIARTLGHLAENVISVVHIGSLPMSIHLLDLKYCPPLLGDREMEATPPRRTTGAGLSAVKTSNSSSARPRRWQYRTATL